MTPRPKSVGEAVAVPAAATPSTDPIPTPAPIPPPPADGQPVTPQGEPTKATLAELPAWKVGQVEEALRALTGAANGALGKAARADLQMTQAEAHTVAVPLTDIINARPALRRLQSSSRAVMLALGVGGYLGRVVQERSENLLAEMEAEQTARRAVELNAHAAPEPTYA